MDTKKMRRRLKEMREMMRIKAIECVVWGFKYELIAYLMFHYLIAYINM